MKLRGVNAVKPWGPQVRKWLHGGHSLITTNNSKLIALIAPHAGAWRTLPHPPIIDFL